MNDGKKNRSPNVERLDLGGIRVLVADDDPIVRSLISQHLVELNAVAVEAEDGAVAWRLLGEQSFDLAIVDLAMPEVDGFQLIARMRGHLAMLHLPILVVTSREDERAVRDAFHAGASSFLSKPVDWPAFEHHLGFLLRMSAMGRRDRSRAQQSAALSRAREVVLGKICQSVSLSAAALADAAADVQRREKLSGRASAAGHSVTTIVEEARALQLLTARVAGLTEILTREVIAEYRRESVCEIIGESVAAVQEMSGEAGVQIGIEVPPSRVFVFCSGESMVLALVQLLRNAITASAAGGRVWVGVRLLPDGVLAITVGDDGIGMDPELVASCLNPMQAHNRGVPVDGRSVEGFGLPLARAIAEAHSGSLEIRSMPGQGTEALLVMPAERVVRLGVGAGSASCACGLVHSSGGGAMPSGAML